MYLFAAFGVACSEVWCRIIVRCQKRGESSSVWYFISDYHHSRYLSLFLSICFIHKLSDMIKKMFKKMEEFDTYLTYVCRYCWSRKSPVLRLQLMEVTVLAESFLYFIFSPGYLRSSSVYLYE